MTKKLSGREKSALAHRTLALPQHTTLSFTHSNLLPQCVEIQNLFSEQRWIKHCAFSRPGRSLLCWALCSVCLFVAAEAGHCLAHTKSILIVSRETVTAPNPKDVLTALTNESWHHIIKPQDKQESYRVYLDHVVSAWFLTCSEMSCSDVRSLHLRGGLSAAFLCFCL